MKKVIVFVLALIIMTTAVVCVSAADFSVQTKSLARGNAYEPYETQIVMTGGNENYTFEHVSGFLPTGLVLEEETGKISGTPTASGGFRNIGIKITSKDDGSSSTVMFTMTIMPRKITVEVTAPQNAVYDGVSTYCATAVCRDLDGSEIELVPTMTYGATKLAAAKDAGTYFINVQAPSGCSITQKSGDSYLVVSPAEMPKITLPEDKTVNFTGEPIGIDESEITVTPPEAGFKILYRELGFSEYTEEKPVDSGVYTVLVHTTNPNFERAEAEMTLTIHGALVDFTIEDIGEIYYGDEYDVNVTPSVVDATYNVVYQDKNGHESSEKPVNAGSYKILIHTIGSFEAGTVTGGEFTILPKPVSVSVSDAIFDYDGEEHTANVEASGLDSSDYYVRYRKSGTQTNLTAAKNAGVYDILVIFPSGNYTTEEGFSEKLTINAVVEPALGNSPAAMIYKDSNHASDPEWQANALAELVSASRFTSFVPEGCNAAINYTPIGDVNPDADKYTLIVEDITSFEDPGLVIHDGVTTEPVKGELREVSGIDGLYELVYKYDSIEKKRYVFEAGKLGDVNGDGHVNGIDANYFDGKNEQPTDVNGWRVWDVDKDGMLTPSDGDAIRNRFKTALSPYYPWLH